MIPRFLRRVIARWIVDDEPDQQTLRMQALGQAETYQPRHIERGDRLPLREVTGDDYLDDAAVSGSIPERDLLAVAEAAGVVKHHGYDDMSQEAVVSRYVCEQMDRMWLQADVAGMDHAHRDLLLAACHGDHKIYDVLAMEARAYLDGEA